jgi:membrane-associated protease RseP (regulator of RpoE activity)
MTNGEDEENAERAEPSEAQPTEPAAAVEPTEPPPPDGRAAAAGTPPPRGGWLLPKWAIVAMVGFVAVALLFGSAFAIGRATASGGDNASNERQFGGRFPREPGEGPTLPRVPRQVSGVFLGVSTEPSTDPQGVRVVNVVSGSPAASAGLQADDVITAVDGTTVSRPAELARQIRSHQSGDQVTIAYSRGGNSAEAQVTLADPSSDNEPTADG